MAARTARAVCLAVAIGLCGACSLHGGGLGVLEGEDDGGALIGSPAPTADAQTGAGGTVADAAPAGGVMVLDAGLVLAADAAIVPPPPPPDAAIVPPPPPPDAAIVPPPPPPDAAIVPLPPPPDAAIVLPPPAPDAAPPLPRDAAPVPPRPDALARPDAAPPPGQGAVACGNTSCLTPQNYCCVGPNNVAACIPRDAACTLGAARRCDGPEDCDGGRICCARAETVGGYRSACLRTTECAQAGGAPTCRSAVECPLSARTCSAASFGGTVIGLCH
jgi:hypothetical protein